MIKDTKDFLIVRKSEPAKADIIRVSKSSLITSAAGNTERKGRIMFKRKKILLGILILAIIAECGFCATIISGSQSLLAGIPNPALVGINTLRVVIIYDNIQLDMAAGLLSNLGLKIEQRLSERDVRLAALIERGYAARFLDTPILRININTFQLTPDRPPVILVATAFAADIQSPSNLNAFVKVDLWTKTETIQAQSVDTELDAISSLALKHIELFANEFIQANNILNPIEITDVNTPAIPSVSSYSPETRKDYNDPNNKTPKSKQPTEPLVQYVGSKGSSVFHKSDCPYAQKILPKNFVTYSTRQEAIDAGKKPCKTCKP